MSKHTYFALDSDVLRNLATLDEYITNHPESTSKDIKKAIEENSKYSPMIKNLDTYLALLNMVKEENPSIRLLVTTTPFKETQAIGNVQKFIENYCYVPNINILTNDECIKQIRKLAKAYCQPFEKLGRIFPPPMQAKYNAYVGDIIPSNDAYVMAEATYYGACLLTENVKDLIAKKSGYRTLEKESYHTHKENLRVRGIVDINIMKGYGQEAIDSVYGDDALNVPKPCAMSNLAKFIKKIDKYLPNYPTTEDKMTIRFSELEK